MNIKEAKGLSYRQKRIYDFLANNRVGVLASVDPDGEPHGSVVYYMVDKRFNVSFLTKSNTKKYDNLVRHKNVMLVVYDVAAQTVAQVIGKAVEVKDSYEVNRIASVVFVAGIKSGSGSVPPVAKLGSGEYTAFRITPDQIRIAIYGRPDPAEHSNKIFDSIESFDLKAD